MTAILEVRDLTTRFTVADGSVLAADRVSFDVEEGECLGVVGESGSGKTQVFMAIMGLLARNGVSTGSVRFRGEEILNLPRRRLDRIRGSRIAMIFQDPMTSLNPYLTCGRQLTEVLVKHKRASREEARRRSVQMLDLVGIPEAARRLDQYPHELSGGMRQRVMIAMALLCEPDLLIADEPTTALDVTIQAQILDLLARLRRELGMAIVLVTHDLGVVAALCERMNVMYAGRIVEQGPVEAVFAEPRHPYTYGLLRSMPRLEGEAGQALEVVGGQPPDLQALPAGCPFFERCGFRFERCERDSPALRLVLPSRAVACHWEDEAAA